MPADHPLLPAFEAPYAPDDGVMAIRLLGAAGLSAEQDAAIDRTATRLTLAIRANDDRLGGVEDMLREFALSTKEGLALMVLAEALLRVPDARTADQFIEDKLGQGDFVHHETRSSAFLVNASAWALGMAAKTSRSAKAQHRESAASAFPEANFVPIHFCATSDPFKGIALFPESHRGWGFSVLSGRFPCDTVDALE